MLQLTWARTPQGQLPEIPGSPSLHTEAWNPTRPSLGVRKERWGGVPLCLSFPAPSAACLPGVSAEAQLLAC